MFSGNLGIQNPGSVPSYARNGSGMFGGMFGNGFGSGLGGFLGGMFGDSGSPYEDAMDKYREWMSKGEGALNPYRKAGEGAIGSFQDWLNGMKDPSKFINNLTSQYQESPFAHFQQQQGIRAANNLGSATGLTGSTPLQMQAQQNAQNISSGDMNQWLQNVLGINSQYGAGQQGLMNQGFNAANSLANMYGNAANYMGDAAYGRRGGQNQDFWNTIGGGLNFLFG